MAALKDANEMPNDADDLNDSSPQAGSADSGWDAYGTFTYVPSGYFATTEGVLIANAQNGAVVGDDGDTSASGPAGLWGVIEG